MPFRDLPDKYRTALRAVLAVTYVFAFYGGLSALIWTPRTIESQLTAYLTIAWAVMAVIGGLCGVWAVLRARTRPDAWRTERWAAPLAAGALLVYASTVWGIAVTETLTRQTQAAWLSAALGLLVYRALELAAYAEHRKRVDIQVHAFRTLADNADETGDG